MEKNVMSKFVIASTDNDKNAQPQKPKGRSKYHAQRRREKQYGLPYLQLIESCEKLFKIYSRSWVKL